MGEYLLPCPLLPVDGSLRVKGDKGAQDFGRQWPRLGAHSLDEHPFLMRGRGTSIGDNQVETGSCFLAANRVKEA